MLGELVVIFYQSNASIIDVRKCDCKLAKALHWCANHERNTTQGNYSSFGNISDTYATHSIQYIFDTVQNYLGGNSRESYLLYMENSNS